MTTVDNNGNITTSGEIDAGLASGQAGQLELPQGTSPSVLNPNTFNIVAPPTVPTAYQWVVPSIQGAGFIYNDGSGQLSYQIPASGTGTGGTGSSIGPSVCAYNSVSQNIPGNSASNSKLTFDTNKWDTGSLHSTTNNPTHFVAPSMGFYLVQVTVIANSSTANFNLSFTINGLTTTPSGAAQGTSGGGMWTSCTYSNILQLNTGDYVEANTYTVSGYSTLASGSIMQMTKLASTF